MQKELIHIDEKILAQKMEETRIVQELLNKALNGDD